MKVPVSNVFILAFVILKNVCHGTILCSQCHTKEDPKCEEDPPAPKPCFDPGDGIPQTCSIIRTFYAGQQIDFRRSCSNSKEGGCFDDPRSGNRVCAQICTTDYCNGPSSSAVFILSPWLLFCAAVTGLFFTVRGQ